MRRASAVLFVVFVFAFTAVPAAHAEPTPAPSPAPTQGTDPDHPGGPTVGDRVRGALSAGAELAERLNPLVTGAARVGRAAGSVGAAAVDGTLCKHPPTPGRPDDGLAGTIDGGPAIAGTGKYSTYGWGPWQPVMYDPGCPSSMLSSVLPEQLRALAPADGANQLARSFTTTSLVALAVGVQSVEIVLTDDGSVWQVLAPLTSFLRVTMGWHMWIAFGAAAVFATALWLSFRAPKGNVDEARRVSFRGAIILSAAALALLTTVTVGALYSQAIVATHQAMSGLASQTAGQPAVSADAAVGDAVADTILYPVWLEQQFGNDRAAAAAFGERLFAASALTRTEAARAQSDPGYAAQIAQAKRADYVQVAAEYQQRFPDTYDRYLAGRNTLHQPWIALMGLLGVAPAALVLLWCMWWVGAGRIVLEVAVAAAPVGGLVAQFPTLQGHAFDAFRFVGTFIVTAFAAVIGFTVFVVGVIGGILGSGLSTPGKVAWLLVILVLTKKVWERREQIVYRRTGVDKSSKAVHGVLVSILSELRGAKKTDAAERAPDAARPAADAPARAEGDPEQVREPVVSARQPAARRAAATNTDEEETVHTTRSDDEGEAVQVEPVETRQVPVRRASAKTWIESEYAPGVNPAPSTTEELRLQFMEGDEVARRVAKQHAAPVKAKESVNVYSST